MLLAVDLAVRHAFTDADGNAVTSVQLGQEFHFRTYVQDVRSSPRGVFQAYFDVTYAADLASVDGAISHLPEYTAETSGNTSTPGRIIGAGGRDWDQYASAPGVEFPLFTVPFQADKAGTLAPVLNVHSDPNGIKLVQFFDSVGQVQPENIGFSGPSLEIVNTNAPLLAISAIDTDKGEGNSGTTPFTFTVTRTVVTTGTTIVNYAVAGSGTYPANAADFGGTLPSGQISFAAGETSKAVTINVSGDTVVESDEGFTVTLSSVSGGATITTPTASGTIRNDDIALRIVAAGADKPEGHSGNTPFTFTVIREGLTTGTTAVDWAVTGIGSNPADAADFGGAWPGDRLTFAPGETSKTITVNIRGDTLVEPDETFQVTLTGASGGAQITTPTASGTIRNDDTALRIVAAGADKPEGHSGNTPFTFTVIREGLTTGTTAVDWAVSGTGSNPANAADFGGTWPGDRLTFAPGETSKTITVNVRGDTLLEPDETFQVTLTGASGGAQITTATATGTIRNDDTALRIVVAGADKPEGHSGNTPFTFTVIREGLTTGSTMVDWAVSGIGSNPADAADFGGTWPGDRLTFAPAETSRTITVNVRGDTVYETDETFQVTLSNPVGAVLGTSVAIGTIRNDDSATFVVTGLTPMTSGLAVDFNAPFNAHVLNLYDNAAGGLGAADVAVIGASVGAVRGSIVVRADKRQLTFLKTGGPLEPDSYTVTLRSAADGFSDSTGNLLDGDANGVAGGDFTHSFVVASRPINEVTVSIPDFVRGFGQAVNLPSETTPGIPVTLSTGQNVAAVDLDLVFDPALLNVTSFTNSVAGATSSFNLVAPGRIRVTVSSTSQFRSTPGTVELGRFIAGVSATAPYAAKQILRLENVNVDDSVPQPRPARADDGLHLAVFVGDGNASRTYTGGDATLQQRLIVGQGSGFSAYPLTDPMLIADVNRSDTLTGGDATLLQRMIVGTPITQAPPPPTGITVPDVAGPDPRLFIPTILTGRPGDTVTIPVVLEVTEPSGISVAAIDLAIAYDPTVFTVSNFVRGPLLDGFGFTTPIVNAATPGILRVTMSAAAGPELAFGATGVVFRFDATVAAEAAEGVSRINLLQNFESTFTGIEDNNIASLTLVPAPTNADNDAVDGVFTVAPLVAVLSIAATDASKAEGNTGSTPFTFTVTRTGDTSGTASVRYAVTGSGTNPANAADFTGNQLPSGTVHFVAGQAAQTITIQVAGDLLVEPDEMFIVTLSIPTDATLGVATAAGTILNDDASLAIAAMDAQKAERNSGSTPFLFTVTRTGDTSRTASVQYAVTGSGSAPANAADFAGNQLPGGTVQFAANETTQTISIQVAGDMLVEPDETFTVTLSNATGATIDAGTAVGTILNDDISLSVSAADANKAEGNSGSTPFTFIVTRRGLTTGTTTVNYVVAGTGVNPADAADFGGTLPGEQVTFAAGETTKTITIHVRGDTTVEANESFSVTLSDASGDAQIETPTAVGTILNDDAAVVSISGPPPTDEGGTGTTLVEFTVTLSAPVDVPVRVDFATADGTAEDENGDHDYESAGGTITFQPNGSLTHTVSVAIVGDTVLEHDETFHVVLRNLAAGTPARSVSLGNATATATIVDDDAARLTIAVTEHAEEDVRHGVFTITTDRLLAEPLEVQLEISGTATAGEDYLPIGTTVMFPAETASVTVVVTVLADDLIEGDETVVVRIVGTSDFAARPGTPDSATLIIVDEDATIVSIVADDDLAAEPATNGQFVVRLGRDKVAPPQGMVVSYSVSGSATPEADYQALPASVTILAGQNSAAVPVVVSDDDLVEPTETVVVTLLGTDNPGATVDPVNHTATVSIIDDDTASVSIVTVNNGAEAAAPVDGRFRVTQTKVSTTDTVVRYTVSGTAAPGAGNDYLPLSGTVTIVAGSTAADIVVTALDDEIVEGTETVIVTLDTIIAGLPAISLGAQQRTAIVEILDDDEATVAIIRVNDGAEADPPVHGRFRVTQTKPGSADTVVSYTVGGTATPGLVNDYLPLSGTVTIAAGQTSADIVVAVLNDTLIEPAETVIVALDRITSGVSGITIDQGNSEATLAIADDLTFVSITAGGENASEPGPGDVYFMVSLRGGKVAPPGGIDVSYTVGGDAAPGSDYVALSGMVTIPGGESSVMIPVIVLDDEVVELPETVVVTLTITGFASVVIDSDQNQATMTIEDDDPTTVSIAASDGVGSESGGNHGEFTVILADGKIAPSGGITVSYAVSGTATAGADYTALSGSVTILAGQSSAVIPVLVLDDAIVELDETVIVTLTGTNHPGATIDLSADTETVNIEDDDPTTVSIVASLPNAAEPNVDGQFTVRLDNGKLAPPGGIAVSYTTVGTAMAGMDYTALSGSVTIPAGAASATIPVVVLDDSVVERAETVVVTLTGTDHPRVSLAGAGNSATVTIADDDRTTVSIVASPPNAAEPNVNSQFTVSLGNGKVAPPGGIVVSYTTTGTATAGSDYTALANSVAIPAGASSATISLTVLDDEIVELDETVSVRLTGTDHPGATIASASDTATVTIADNDPTTVSIIASLPNAAEPNVNGQFTVQLGNGKVAPSGGIVVSYTTTGTATAGLDYTSLPGSVTIPAGASSATITVTVLEDEIVEVDETVIITLTETNHARATIHATANFATVTIDSADDDTTVSIQASDVTGREPGTDGGQFTVTLDGGKVAPVGGIVVSYTTGGTATAGADFTALPGTVTIPAGASSATIPVAVLDDNVVEIDETVIVTLTGTNHPGATVASANNAATVTIEDDDQTTVSIIASDANAGEPNDHGEFTVRLDNNKIAPAGGIVVSYTVGGTATPGSDYTALPGTVTILAGQSSAVIPVNVIADSTPDEPAETVVVTLASANHPGVSLIATNPSATVTIAEDDPRNASISGVVWADANNDGRQQKDGDGKPLEPGIPGVIVWLTGTARNGTRLDLQAMTDDDGSYRFIDLPAGTYEIREEQPSAWIDGQEWLASSTVNDTYSNVMLAPSQQAENYSFGERGLRPQFISKRQFLASTPPNDVYFRELNALAMQLAGDAATAQAIRDARIASVVSAKAATGSVTAAQNGTSPAGSESRPAPSAVMPADGESSRVPATAPPADGESSPVQAAAPALLASRTPGGEGETPASVSVPSVPLVVGSSATDPPSARAFPGAKLCGGRQSASSAVSLNPNQTLAGLQNSDSAGHLETAHVANRRTHDAASMADTSKRAALDNHFAAIAGEFPDRGSSRPSPATRYPAMHGRKTGDNLDMATGVDLAFAEDNWLDIPRTSPGVRTPLAATGGDSVPRRSGGRSGTGRASGTSKLRLERALEPVLDAEVQPLCPEPGGA